jgi:hypothetical protein
MLDIGLSNFSPSHSIFGYLYPAPASRSSHNVIPPGPKASNTTFTETRSPLQNSFTRTVVDSTVNMASPLPLQRNNTMSYVGDFSSLQVHLVSDSILQINSEHSSDSITSLYTKTILGIICFK